MKKPKDTSLLIRMSEADKEALVSVAEALDVSASQVVRDAVREKVAETRRTHPLMQQTAQVTVNA